MPEQNLSDLLSVFYRISDAPTPNKCCQREVCFINFLSVFQGLPITVLADNVGPKTLQFVSQPGVKVIQTNLGNSGSFLKQLELACEASTMFAYFCEDDYIHRQESARLVIEGLRWSNYVTLYDHPDKYLRERGYGEVGRTLKSETWHWRQTISTTNTFGANLGILRQDMDIFRKHAQTPVPADHYTWVELSQKKRTLTVSIPGAAFNTHRVCEHSNFDWGQNWAAKQIQSVGEIIKASRDLQSRAFQTPPEDVEFNPVDLTTGKPANSMPKPLDSGLPDLAAMGRTTQQLIVPNVPLPETPPDDRQIVSEPSKIRKKQPQTKPLIKPPLAIPDPVALHKESLNKKKFEVQEGQFGTFIPLG
jgi:hypothetical protein